MLPEERKIKIEKSARYYLHNPSPDEIRNVVFVIHGYAQLAGEFIKEFDFLSDNNTLIIAPEGLSKFYFRNKIAASWMTKEDRLNEINDYLNFLDKVFDEVKSMYSIDGAKVYVLGYSQGVHTAVRWFINSDIKFEKLILCSSDFPKDADFNALSDKLVNSELVYLQGEFDDVVPMDTFIQNKKLFSENNIPFTEIIFKGKHEINKESVLSVINS